MSCDFRAASRLHGLGVSEILVRSAQALALRRQGRDMIIFGAGEPDFDTPDHVKEAAAAAIRAGETKYTALDGSPQMKDAVRAKFRRENGLDFGPDQIIVSAGAKQVLYNAFVASLEAGDEVLIPAPYWTSYIDIVRICGGVPVPLPCREEDGFLLQPAALEQAIGPRTRWLLLNSPSNPSGGTYDRAAFAALGDVLTRHPQIWVVADEIYEHILFDGASFTSFAAAVPALADRTLTINGVSKAYAMTGWRIGYGAGPASLVAAMAIVQSQSTSCPSSVSQAAAIAAIEGPQDAVRAMCAAFEQRRDLVVATLEAVPGLACRKPGGAFYAYVSCAGVIGKRASSGRMIADDRSFADHLLDHGVAVIPGACFGLSPYFRLSFACSREELVEGLGRIARGCADLSSAAGSSRLHA